MRQICGVELGAKVRLGRGKVDLWVGNKEGERMEAEGFAGRRVGEDGLCGEDGGIGNWGSEKMPSAGK